jgi:hypothetical protein
LWRLSGCRWLLSMFQVGVTVACRRRLGGSVSPRDLTLMSRIRDHGPHLGSKVSSFRRTTPAPILAQDFSPTNYGPEVLLDAVLCWTLWRIETQNCYYGNFFTRKVLAPVWPSCSSCIRFVDDYQCNECLFSIIILRQFFVGYENFRFLSVGNPTRRANSNL